jgi:hypothetical protein
LAFRQILFELLQEVGDLLVLQIFVLSQRFIREDLRDRLFGGALRDHADGSAAFVDVGQHFVDEFQAAVDVHVVQDFIFRGGPVRDGVLAV